MTIDMKCMSRQHRVMLLQQRSTCLTVHACMSWFALDMCTLIAWACDLFSDLGKEYTLEGLSLVAWHCISTCTAINQEHGLTCVCAQNFCAKIKFSWRKLVQVLTCFSWSCMCLAWAWAWHEHVVTWHEISMSLAWACAWYDQVLGLSYTLHFTDRLELELGLSMSYRIEYKLSLSIWLVWPCAS